MKIKQSTRQKTVVIRHGIAMLAHILKERPITSTKEDIITVLKKNCELSNAPFGSNNELLDFIDKLSHSFHWRVERIIEKAEKEEKQI